MSRDPEPLYITSMLFLFTASSVKQRMTVDVRKGVRNSVSGQADRCKALEAHPPSEEGKQVSLIVIDIASC